MEDQAYPQTNTQQVRVTRRPTLVVGGVLALLLIVGGTFLGLRAVSKPTSTESSADEGQVSDAPLAMIGSIRDTRVKVELKEFNRSTQSGVATLVSVGEGMTASIELTQSTSEEEIFQPVSIYKGTCLSPGEQLFVLPPVSGGFAEGDVRFTREQLQEQLPLSVVVGKSEQEPTMVVACGEITI